MSEATPSSCCISVSGFKKTFKVGLLNRPSVATSDVNFSVERGEVFGFLGPNGAGKTTTIKALLGLIRPDGGDFQILGHSPDSLQWRRRVGYMPEHPNFHDFLTGLEMVTWFGQLAGMSSSEASTRAKEVLIRVGLEASMTRRLRGYSKGMLQRAGLAQALVASPELLILDEPMTGLDPIGRRDMRRLILELKAEGKTVFYSTHILPDVEMTCDRVTILNKGKTVKTGNMQAILTETKHGVRVVLSDVSAEATDKLGQSFDIELRDGHVEFVAADEAQAQETLREQLTQGARLLRFEPIRDSLEGIFVRSLDGAGDSK